MSTGHVRQRGVGSWEIRYELPRDPDGKRRTRTTTVKGGKRDAQRELRRVLAEVDAGTHVDKSKTTLATFTAESIDQWQASGRITGRTAERYRDDAANYVIPHLGARELQRLTTRDLEAWHAKLLSAGGRRGGLATLTVRHAHRLLGQVLARAAKHGLVARNVAAIERAPAPERDEIQILRPEQIAPMLEKLSGHPMHAMVVTALYTGVRRGEMLALTWADVDLDDGATLTVARSLEETRQHGVRVKAPKSERGRRRISLPALVVRVLRAHRIAQLERRVATGAGRTDLVFPGPGGGQWTPSHFSTEWRRAVRKLGLPGVTWHALRHTHASQLIHAGVDVVTISKRLGHATAAFTLRAYAHMFSEDDRKAADAIDQLAR